MQHRLQVTTNDMKRMQKTQRIAIYILLLSSQVAPITAVTPANVTYLQPPPRVAFVAPFDSPFKSKRNLKEKNYDESYLPPESTYLSPPPPPSPITTFVTPPKPEISIEYESESSYASPEAPKKPPPPPAEPYKPFIKPESSHPISTQPSYNTPPPPPSKYNSDVKETYHGPLDIHLHDLPAISSGYQAPNPDLSLTPSGYQAPNPDSSLHPITSDSSYISPADFSSSSSLQSQPQLNILHLVPLFVITTLAVVASVVVSMLFA